MSKQKDEGAPRRATTLDYSGCIDCLVEAFQRDPLAHWLFPSPDRRKEAHKMMFTNLLAGLHADDRVYVATAGGFETAVTGVTVWLRHQHGDGDVPPGACPASAALFAEVAAAEPIGPRWYLAFIACRVSGTGLGTRLIKHGLTSICEEDETGGEGGGSACLWTGNPKNVRFYEKFGFRRISDHIAERGAAAGGATITWMSRS